MNTITIILILVTALVLGLGWRATNKPEKPRVRREPPAPRSSRAADDAPQAPRRVR
jgi:hypothetical protein